MPTNRQKRVPRRRARIDSERTVTRLLTGHDWPFLDGFAPALTDEELRAAWKALGKELLKEFIEKNPGRRPWAWWQFEAKEPRRVVGVDVIDLPACGSQPARRCQYDIIETEAAYLRRLGLLSPAEEQALAEAASE